tara:strand:- start:48164 stop:49102 length:939 start_codon:yes stop_codon:yes gene_type:complete
MFNMSSKFKGAMRLVLVTGFAIGFFGCGGGGGSSPVNVLYYPYQTIFEKVCMTVEPTPGCTFDARTGERISVSADPAYDRRGHATDDMWFVEFDEYGMAAVYDQDRILREYKDVSEFGGYLGTYDIGTGGYNVATGETRLVWEDIRNGAYYLGKNGVLYSANLIESNFGQAINNKNASKATDTNFAALNSDANKILVAKGAEKLMKEYGFKKAQATAVASVLNNFAVTTSLRGKVTTKDIDVTFKGAFGVPFSDALTAVNKLREGDKSSMRELTNRSASALGLKPHQAQQFIKGMYKKALTQWGYDVDTISW